MLSRFHSAHKLHVRPFPAILA